MAFKPIVNNTGITSIAFSSALYRGNLPVNNRAVQLALPQSNGYFYNGLIVARDIATRLIYVPFDSTDAIVAQGTSAGSTLTLVAGSGVPSLGEAVTGPGIAVSTTVTAVASGVVTLSKAVLYASTGDFTFRAYELYGVLEDSWLDTSATGYDTLVINGVSDGAASSVISNLDTTLPLPTPQDPNNTLSGKPVSGPGVPAGTFILANNYGLNGTFALSAQVPAGPVALTVTLSSSTSGSFKVGIADDLTTVWYYNRLFGKAGYNTTTEIDFLVSKGYAQLDTEYNGGQPVKTITFRSTFRNQ